MKQSSAFCRNCNAQVMVTKPGVNHLLHLILTILTAGLWLLIWIPLMLFGGGSWRCAKCGLKT
jgi:hypothetical protein